MKTIKVAIADDHPGYRNGIAVFVKDFEGMELVIEAGNGKELIEQLRTTAVDVVLVDLKMPVMDGRETIDFIKLRYPEIRIIVLTMYDEEYMVIRTVKMGVHGYVTKGAEPIEIEESIRRSVTDGYYFNNRTVNLMRKYLIDPKLANAGSIESNFSKRELEVLFLICKEYTNVEIADKLGLSPRTIDGHRNKLVVKTKARNTAGLTAFAIENGIFLLELQNP